MNYLDLFIKLVPLILSLVSAAETVYDKRSSGATKKRVVKKALAAAYTGARCVSTGDQAETLKKLEPLVNSAIDAAAGIMFPNPQAYEEVKQ